MSDDFKQLESLVIKNQDLISFFDKNQVIQLAFNEGGWIAGGFPREIFKLEDPFGNLGANKIDFEDIIQSYFSRGGDIDFFFKEEKIVNSLRDKQPIGTSVYGGPNNFAFTTVEYQSYTSDDDTNKYFSIAVQLVNKFFYDSIEETFRGFDFYNSCYAIQKVEDKYILTYLKKAQELDQNNTIRINHVNSPYTIQRIVKYMKRKNLHKIEDESIQKVVDLVYNLGFESFDEKYNFDQFKNRYFEHLKYVFEKLPIDPGIALVFLGKFKTLDDDTVDSYGPVVTIDWAMKVIRDCVSTS